jgi:uncharacterized membrane protein
MRAKDLARIGLLTALALVLSYLESLVPLSFAVPGIKMGLPNIVIVFALYRFRWRDAAPSRSARAARLRCSSATCFSLLSPRGRSASVWR